MSGIFISYRRGDSRGTAGRLYDDLEERFGKNVVFRDLDAIEPGAEYSEVIDSAIARCDALIAVIGNEWLEMRDSEGRRRIDNPDDLVRLEIASALSRNKLVLPVLVEDAVMPPAADLPPDLAELAGRNALSMSDDRWEYDLGRLVDRLQRVVAPKKARRAAAPTKRASTRRAPSTGRVPQKRIVAIVGSLIALILLLVGGIVLGGSDDDGAEVRAGSPGTTAGSSASDQPTGSPGGSSPAAGQGNTFRINLGDTVAEGKPPGAGKIATPGAVQRYTFEAKAKQTIFLEMLSVNEEGEGLSWTLYNPSSTYVRGRAMPEDIGRLTLPLTGTYSLEVEGLKDGTGTYSFSLTTVTPENLFAINIGETVGDGHPPGAGNIVKPGMVQRYTFQATAGQVVYLKVLSPKVTGGGLFWTLYNPSDEYVSSRPIPEDIGRQNLKVSGTYAIEVEGNKGATGTYSFALTGV